MNSQSVSDVFFSNGSDEHDELEIVGNHADKAVDHFRPATDSEIKEHLDGLPDWKLCYYVDCLTMEQIENLLK